MTKITTDPIKIDEILDRGTIVEVFPSKKSLKEKLLSGKKMRFYIGLDATAPTLHLSHAKNFIFLEKIRKLNHEVIILFGDFTARIGDPTGNSSARKKLSRKEVLDNIKKWKKLISPLMDFNNKQNPPIIRHNHKWLSKITMEDFIDLASNLTVQQLMARDMFQQRIKEKKPIYLHEFIYPLMQGYDSVVMDVDVEVCGTDQTFNALIGRDLLKKNKQKDKQIITLTLMENPKTGEMMSKSKGVGVFLGGTATQMYGEIMSQNDEMTELLFINNTNLPLDEIKEIMKSENPKDSKEKLSFEIVKIFYGEKEAIKAQNEFKKVFQKKEIPSEIKEVKIKEKEIKIIDLLVLTGLAKSKGEARRIIDQKGFKLNGKKEVEWKKIIRPEKGMVLSVGKRKFIKLG